MNLPPSPDVARLPGTDPARAAKWVSGVHPAPWTISAMHPTGTAPITLTTSSVAEMARFIDRFADTHGLYYEANMIAEGVPHNKKLGKDEVGEGLFVKADFDEDTATGLRLVQVEGAKAAMAQRLIDGDVPGTPGPATYVNDSGNGVQALWALADPVKLQGDRPPGSVSLSEFEGYGRWIAEQAGGDHCWACNHLFRIPWTTNYPNAKKLSEGLVPVLTQALHEQPSITYYTFDLQWDGLLMSTKADLALGSIEVFEDLAALRERYELPDALVARLVGDLSAEKGEPGYVDSNDEWAIIKDLYRTGMPLEAVMGVLAHEDFALGRRMRQQAAAGSRTAQEYIDYTAQRLADAFAKEQQAEVAEFEPMDPLWNSENWNEGIDASTEAPEKDGKKLPPIKIWNYDDLLAEPEPDWIIETLIIQDAIGMLYGGPKAGKTFLALDMALCVAAGKPFLGLDVSPGRVLYIAAENNKRYLGERIFAWCKVNNVDEALVRSNLDIVTQSVMMNNEPSVKNLLICLAALGKIRYALVVVDTLNKNMEGDENKGDVMSMFYRGLDALKRLLRTSILVIHHTTKDGEDYRGSSVTLGTVDYMLSLSKTKPPKALRAAKGASNKPAQDEQASNKDLRALRIVASREAEEETTHMLRFGRFELPWKDKKDRPRVTRYFSPLGTGHQDNAPDTFDPADTESEVPGRGPMTDENLLVRIFIDSPKTAKDLADEDARGWGLGNVKKRVTALRKAGLIDPDTLKLTPQGVAFVGEDALGEGYILG